MIEYTANYFTITKAISLKSAFSVTKILQKFDKPKRRVECQQIQLSVSYYAPRSFHGQEYSTES